MTDDRLVTLAIHSYQKALILQSILEHEGIPAWLHNVNEVQPVVSEGVRVRINSADLQRALKIVENINIGDGNGASDFEAMLAGDRRGAHSGPVVLVPVDFSPHSDSACKIAFKYAAMIGARVELMHAYITPSSIDARLTSIDLNFDFDAPLDNEELAHSIEASARKQMDALASKLRHKIEQGEIAPARFTTTLYDDVAEDAIAEVAKQLSPTLIVMGTRSHSRKEADTIGSVTAEVLDACRFPVFTVPEGMKIYDEYPGDLDIHVVMFANYDPHDIDAIDTFCTLFPTWHSRFTILNFPTKKLPMDATEFNKRLASFCRERYPQLDIHVHPSSLSDLEAEFSLIEQSHDINFLVVPNKKRNAFSRLFNPGLAHRLLFEADIPLLVIPI